MNENYVEMMAAEDTRNQGQAENFMADPGIDVQVEHSVRGWKSAVRKGWILVLAGAILMTQMNVSAAVKNEAGSTYNWGSFGSNWDFGNWGSWIGSGGSMPGGSAGEPQVKKLPAPVMKEYRYVHMNDTKKEYLLVTWDAVEGADHYEMVIQKRYGGEQTYMVNGTRVHITRGSDPWIPGCIRGSKIRVRAIDGEGVEGEWSEWKTVGCNSLAG